MWSAFENAFRQLRDQLVRDYAQRLELFVQAIIDSLLIVLLAVLLMTLIRRFVARIVDRADRVKLPAYRRKLETIGSLGLSTAKYAVYIAALMWILVIWGADKNTLIAGSAVIGAAIGFGSQGLIQDLITGLSLLAEEQLAVGDYVEINGKAGAVEEIGLRVVKIRDQLGVQHVIFNRTIGMVSNYTSGATPAVVDVSLENAEAGERAREVATKVGADLAKELPYFTAPPTVEGVLQSSTHDVFLRIRLNVLPQQQDVVQNLFVDRIKRAFATEKIAIPGDRVRVVVFSELFRKAIERTRQT